MSSISVAYHIIIIITITITKAGPEPRTTTPRPDSVGPPAGWLQGRSAPTQTTKTPGPETSTLPGTRQQYNLALIATVSARQAGSSSAASTDAPCRLSLPTCRSTHARLAFFFFYLVFHLTCLTLFAQPSAFVFLPCFFHRLFLAIPKPCFVPLVYPFAHQGDLFRRRLAYYLWPLEAWGGVGAGAGVGVVSAAPSAAAQRRKANPANQPAPPCRVSAHTYLA
jgi:hypothetical protein